MAVLFSNYSDANGHGTYVVGIIGALHNRQGLFGIAPEADGSTWLLNECEKFFRHRDRRVEST
ncbi:S8 family serine peptidase [Paenibacillus periandrae]|uniref:S8 family serine peptidase n=1 Tax=Paenibacillus periandrae TaxID=1761741 RepID=UPI0023DDD499|nr:S8 family serine peptidase [Paenibacillus periandrae]